MTRRLACLAAVAVVACGKVAPRDEPAPADVALQSVRLWSSPTDLLLSGVAGMAVDSRDRVYAWDRDLGIVVLDPDGVVIRTIGRKGEGPGEFEWPGDLQVLAGDSLLAYDPGLGRVTVFLPDSAAVAYTHLLAGQSGRPGPRRVRRVHDPAGYLGLYAPMYSPMDDAAQKAREGPVLSLLALDGTIVRDSVLALPPEPSIVLRRSSGDQAALLAIANPFASRNAIEVTPEGHIVHGWTDSLAVALYDLAGRRVGGFSAPHEPLPVTSEEVDRIVARFGETPPGDPWGDEPVQALRDAARQTWPAFQRLLVDDEGRIWLQLTTREGTPRRWRVFRRTGEGVGTVEFPARFGALVVAGDVAYGIEHDELDVPSIVAYRVGGWESAE